MNFDSMSRGEMIARLIEQEKEIIRIRRENLELTETATRAQESATANFQVARQRELGSLRGMVREFMTMVDQDLPEKPTAPSVATTRLRLRLITEEFFETFLAATGHELGLFEREIVDLIDHLSEKDDKDFNIFEVVDGLADMMVVIEGTFLAFGVDSGPILAEVHRSNMSKLGGSLDANGKATKGPNYSPPDIAGELRKQGWEE